MSKVFATYHKHHGDDPEGHIYLDKEGACTITLEGAASMSQDELDSYGEIMAEALNKSSVYRGKKVYPYPSHDYTGG
jgi:hypothetical protein|tara:strand:- start:379 stop:609 length:231 start_codon:yes stop_codon:yes gene_type:complete